MNIKKLVISLSAGAIILGATIIPSFAESLSTIDFEGYTLGTINSQDGWTSLGAAGSGCAVYDHAVSGSLGTTGFGTQSLRISNAVTSGCFGDQTFSKPLINAVGETGAGAGVYSIGTLQTHFETEFDIASALPNTQQAGLFMSVSPDRGDGSRMSYLGFEDVTEGINVIFYDTPGTTNPANFSFTDLGTFPRNVKHHIKLTFDAIDGPSNDVVKVWIDGTLTHTGTSWENYFRFDSEANAEQNVRAVRSMLFRSGGAPAPANAGNGFLIDNLSLMSGPIPVDPLAVPAQCLGIEGLGAPIIGTAGSDSINGTSGNDLIFALGGSDRVDGKGGDDCIVGGDGSDKLIGGNGNDVILGGAGSDSIEGNNQEDTLYGEGGSDSIKGGNQNDTLNGGDDSDSLRGEDGADILNGDGGSDSLRGGNNNDTLTGGDGVDSAKGEAGNNDVCDAESENTCEA